MTGNRPARLKYSVLALFVLAAALGTISATQTWYTFHLTAATGHPEPIAVPGSNAAPALTALALTGIALAGALALAGRFARIVLGVLGLVLGGCVLAEAIGVMSSPAAAGIGAITKATGVAGDAAVEHLVDSVATTGWPAAAVVSGALFLIAGAATLITGRAWPGSSRKYQATRFAPVATDADPEYAAPAGRTRTAPEEPSARDIAIDDWDELTRGDDPTE